MKYFYIFRCSQDRQLTIIRVLPTLIELLPIIKVTKEYSHVTHCAMLPPSCFIMGIMHAGKELFCGFGPLYDLRQL